MPILPALGVCERPLCDPPKKEVGCTKGFCPEAGNINLEPGTFESHLPFTTIAMANIQVPPMPDENKGPQVLGSCTAVTILALILVGARLYVRARVVKSVGLDDYAILASMVTHSLSAISTTLSRRWRL